MNAAGAWRALVAEVEAELPTAAAPADAVPLWAIVTPRELALLRAAAGLTRRGPTRDHLVTWPAARDRVPCADLVARGLMTGPALAATADNEFLVYVLTPLGWRVLRWWCRWPCAAGASRR